MGGHRRKQDRPRRAVTRVAARARAAHARLAATTTWVERVGPAAEWVRAGLVRLAKTDREAAERVAERLVQLLLQMARELDAEQKKVRR